MIAVSRTNDLATCLALRRSVFTEEQGVAVADEVDGRDPQAIHFLATDATGPVGTARMLVSGDTAKIGRVCVLARARGQGAGAALIRAAVAQARGVPGRHARETGRADPRPRFLRASGLRGPGCGV